ncbi:ABC transporter substrate-binding protein [Tabrizicola sp.]|jgi:ABC-type nitrate/sulfonate/bicarbonate transport system substrate-binding protein|uniref:ABC transporter substrate-binding protein n=1 Tax=Tabrizicola sp. TaxID=2005166 RepID=UPI0025E2D810|nr:ABC transporter substrate-binding protein [Tabrizicola sp.]
MQSFVRRTAIGWMVAAALFGQTLAALAEETPVRVAYFLADSMLPALYAQDKGYFSEAGLDVEFVAVQTGPAVVSAVASGEADIGYAAPVPPINGRLNGVPVKMFLQLSQELAPDKTYTWLVASKASGIADLAGVKGKKIGFNANGGLCELMWRDHLASVGLTIDDVVPVVLPFPEQEAALQQGNLDATCTINPFHVSMLGNAELGVTMLATGTLADLSQPLMNDALFATDDWLAANGETATTVARVMDKARKELLSDRAALSGAAEKYMELAPEAAASFVLPIVNESMLITPADVQRILDAMVKTGLNPGPLNGADFVYELKY